MEEIERYGVVDPLFNNRIKPQLLSVFGDNAVFGGGGFNMVCNFEGDGDISEQLGPRSVVYVFHFKGDLYVVFDVGNGEGWVECGRVRDIDWCV